MCPPCCLCAPLSCLCDPPREISARGRKAASVRLCVHLAEDVPRPVSPWRDPPPADAAGSPPPAAVIRKEKRRRMCLRPSSTYTAHSVVSKCALRKFCALLLRIISPPPLCFLPVLHSLYQRNNALYNLHVSRRFDNAALQLFFSPFLCTRLY